MTATDRFIRAYSRISCGYSYMENDDGVGVFSLPALVRLPGIRHGFSARTGGISVGCLSSLNLSFSRGIEPREKTMENYRIFALRPGLKRQAWLWIHMSMA